MARGENESTLARKTKLATNESLLIFDSNEIAKLESNQVSVDNRHTNVFVKLGFCTQVSVSLALSLALVEELATCDDER